jgi:hypothetical protein
MRGFPQHDDRRQSGRLLGVRVMGGEERLCGELSARTSLAVMAHSSRRAAHAASGGALAASTGIVPRTAWLAGLLQAIRHVPVLEDLEELVEGRIWVPARPRPAVLVVVQDQHCVFHCTLPEGIQPIRKRVVAHSSPTSCRSQLKARASQRDVDRKGELQGVCGRSAIDQVLTRRPCIEDFAIRAPGLPLGDGIC